MVNVDEDSPIYDLKSRSQSRWQHGSESVILETIRATSGAGGAS